MRRLWNSKNLKKLIRSAKLRSITLIALIAILLSGCYSSYQLNNDLELQPSDKVASDHDAWGGANQQSGNASNEISTPAGDPSEDSDQGSTEDSTFLIHFIDVGQADAALIECDGHYMLIDGGNRADSNTIYSVLKRYSVSVLDIVVGTHAHEDHIGGIPGAFNYTTAKLTLCPVTDYDSDAFRNFKKYADQNGGGITVPSVGDVYYLGSAEITILGINGGEDTNDTSIVLMIRYGSTTFLFTGDAEREAEQAIINSGTALSATVLKVGHHGSDTSTSYLFLRSIAPQYAVISVGTDNSYGHPAEDTLSRLRDADVTVFRTDLQGDIICTSDGTEVTFTVSRNANADTLAPAAGQNNNQSSQNNNSSDNDSDADDDTSPDNGNSSDQGDSGNNGAPVHNYVGNKNTKKFHYAGCRHVDSMKESNKYYFTGTREEMLSKGYEPCGTCKP